MLELKLEKENLFLKVLEAILDLVDVAHVDCSSKGLKLQAVDTEIVALIVLFFPAENFQHYRCDEDLSMGIAIDVMVKAIGCADKDDSITIKVGDKNCDTITLSFESPKITVAYDLRLVDANNQRFRIPDWQDLASEYQAFSSKCPLRSLCVSASTSATSAAMVHRFYITWVIYKANYYRRMEDSSSEQSFLSPAVVVISATEEGMDLFASGIIGAEATYFIKRNMALHLVDYIGTGEATATVVTVGAPVSMTLDLKYMNSFAKASTLFNEVEIYLSTTQPLMVECKIEHMGYIRYFLPPKVKIEIEEEEITLTHTRVLCYQIGTWRSHPSPRSHSSALPG
ncbi:hypothetical protein PR202_ga06326 [Eleusine coracana subsp. coracana]|uniref:DNA sliding clamp PCNA n=1 Tax=Eleusine coracana subsp. coracana TaxID=191504 RepID=A0AAV5BWK8_ELECO|nr:hypothetical protein PR202_ga06326 [Eleusine coracana subsp. coracana]